jgi:hypothetical protein
MLVLECPLAYDTVVRAYNSLAAGSLAFTLMAIVFSAYSQKLRRAQSSVQLYSRCDSQGSN